VKKSPPTAGTASRVIGAFGLLGLLGLFASSTAADGKPFVVVSSAYIKPITKL
jgi:hypothetical protein